MLKRLTNVYFKLWECELIKGNVNDLSMQEFADLLDLTLPLNSEEEDFEKFIKASYRKSKQTFMNMLPGKSVNSTSDLSDLSDKSDRSYHRSVVLLTEPSNIVEEFGVGSLIFLKYNPHTRSYSVTKLLVPNKKHIGPVRQNALNQVKRKKEIAEKFSRQLEEFLSGDIN